MGVAAAGQRIATHSLLRALVRITLGAMVLMSVLPWAVTAWGLIADGAGVFDFSFYYTVALALRDQPHANVYDPAYLRAVAAAHHTFLGAGVYHYPPLLPLLIVPLTLLPLTSAAHLYLLFNLALWLAATVLLADLLRRLLGSASLNGYAVALAVFLSLSYEQVAAGVQLGQASVLIFYLLTLALWLLQRGHGRSVGVILAVATWIKVFPVLLIGYALVSGRRRILVGAAWGLGAIGLLIGMIVGVPGMLAMQGILSNGTSDSANGQNEALARAPQWVALAIGARPGMLTTALGWLLVALIGGVYVVGLLAARRAGQARDAGQPLGNAQRDGETGGETGGETDPQRARATRSISASRERELLGMSWSLATMILVSPLTYGHHNAWLLPAFVVCFGVIVRGLLAGPRDTAGHVRRELWLLFALVAGYMLTMYALPFAFEGNTRFDLGPYLAGHPLRPFAMVSRPLGAVLLWCVAGALYLRASSVRVSTRFLRAGARLVAQPTTFIDDVSTASPPTPEPSMRMVAGVCLLVLTAVLVARIAVIAAQITFAGYVVHIP